MIIRQNILDSIDKLVDYNYEDEQKDYESLIDREVTENEMCYPDSLPNQEHIFYHILVVQNFLNQ